MRREDLADLAAFAAVAEARSFTRAARQLGLSQSALSQIVKRLEARLGVSLIARTTRSVAATPAGERLRQTLDPMLRELDASLGDLAASRDRPAGLVRVTSVEHAARTILLPSLARVLDENPGVTVEIVATYAMSDVVAEGFDAGVRLGGQVARDMVALRISPDIPMAIVGAPSYFAANPPPQSAQALTDHRAINLRLPTSGAVNAWRLSEGGRDMRVRLGGPLVLDSIDLIGAACLAGAGLAYLPLDQVEAHLSAGSLTRVLADSTPPLPGYHLYYESRRRVSAAFRLVINALRPRA